MSIKVENTTKIKKTKLDHLFLEKKVTHVITPGSFNIIRFLQNGSLGNRHQLCTKLLQKK